MFLLDVNVVVALHRPDHVHHAAVRTWQEQFAAPFTVPAVVWHGFLRIVTSRRIFDEPSSREQAFEFVAAVKARPDHLETAPGVRHVEILRRICDEADVAGPLVSDGVVAALAVECGARVVTLDRDFARFASVEHLRPPGC